MKPLACTLCLAAVAILASASSAHAQGPGGYAAQGNFSFAPFGFYQPYGAVYGTSLRTPPYFALNPPVYYGARYSRPYGLSPFAAPPMLSPPADYHGRTAARFVQPPTSNPYIVESCGTCVGANDSKQSSGNVVAMVAKGSRGEVRNNPFVQGGETLVGLPTNR